MAGNKYTPSSQVRKRISDWEGAAMHGSTIDPLSKKRVARNNSIDNEASLFASMIPEEIRERVFSNQELADNLFSYSYNVGSHNFKKRVVPTLMSYYSGKASARDVADTMSASGDSKLRGLQKRRNYEKSHVVSALQKNNPIYKAQPSVTPIFTPDALRVGTSYPTYVESTTPVPVMVPDENSFILTHQQTPEERSAMQFNQRMEDIQRLNRIFDIANIKNIEIPKYTPRNNPYVISSYSEGGKLKKKSWDDLSMKEKSEMIGVAVRQGYTNISDIRDKYNEFAEGGDTEDDEYYSTMERVAEENNSIWNKQRIKEGVKPLSVDAEITRILNDNTYDYRGYYSKYPQSKANADTHWTDEFKTVWHPTFSRGSRYSGNKSQYNPIGLPGGLWSEDTFIPMAWQVDANEYKSGGSIYIKPENRGKFIALKERTGHSATWFKEHGTPAQKKMATFALNARKWKHGDGGNLFDGTSQPTQQMQIGRPFYKQVSTANIFEDLAEFNKQKELEQRKNIEALRKNGRKLAERRVNNYLTTSNDATSNNSGRIQNTHLAERAIEGAKAHRAWEEEHPNLSTWSNTLAAAPFAVAATPAVLAGGEALFPVLTNPYVDAAITSGFAGHGLNHAINEGIDGWGDAAMTAAEIVPLGRMAKPMWNAAKNNAKAFYNNLTMDLTSTPGTYYVGYPKRDLSTLMPGKSGGIFLTPDKKFARGYTGAFGTGKVYETKVNFGENPIHINAKGRHFDSIAERDLLDAFDTTVEEMRELGLKPFYTKKDLFSKKPPQRYYHIDEISTFGKKKGASSLIVDNVFDQGPGIFGFGTKGVGQQVIVYSPEQISLLKSTPKITTENAASITPEQWTAAQDAAIARGDMAEAQRLKDLHFMAKAPDTKIVDKKGRPLHTYHGTKAKFNAFDESKYGNTDGGLYGTGVYTSPYKDYSSNYGDIVLDLYHNIKNPVDARKYTLDDLMLGKLEEGKNLFRWEDIGGKRDGVLGRNMHMTTEYPYEIISHSPTQVKSADAVTYDNSGVRIPLGKRDNFNINDIRYGLVPIVMGLTGYGMFNNSNYKKGEH